MPNLRVSLAAGPGWDRAEYEAPSHLAALDVAETYAGAILGADAGFTCVRVEIAVLCDACHGKGVRPGKVRACPSCVAGETELLDLFYVWSKEIGQCK